MGEIAEMMLDGTLCAGCGEFLDGDGEGFPRYCSKQCAAGCGMTYTPSSARARKAARINRDRQRGDKWFQCSKCSKRFRYASAVSQHERDAHAKAQESSNGK